MVFLKIMLAESENEHENLFTIVCDPTLDFKLLFIIHKKDLWMSAVSIRDFIDQMNYTLRQRKRDNK